MKTLLDITSFCVTMFIFAQLIEVLYREHSDRHYIQAGAYGFPGAIARRWWCTRRVRVWFSIWLVSVFITVLVWTR